MKFNPESFSAFIDPSESMRGVSVDMSISIGSSSIAEESCKLMCALRCKTPEVPSRGRILEVSSGIFLLGVNEIGEFNGVSNEEYWSIVSCHIPVTFFGVKFDCKSSWISIGIGSSSFSCDSGESSENWSFLSNGIEDFRLGVFGDIMGDFEVSMSSCSLGMDDSFGDTFSIEVGEFVNEMEVSDGDGSIFTCGY